MVLTLFDKVVRPSRGNDPENYVPNFVVDGPYKSGSKEVVL